MIFRNEKNKNNVSIHKGFLKDKSLSFRAKGVMAYCMVGSDSGDFNFQDLIEVSKEGRDAIYSAINELITAGYVIKKLNRENGKFKKGFYEIHETPQLKPATENQNELNEEIE